MMTSQSPIKLFSTTELFEAVLFQLPLRDLLRVQRVCHRWRDVIVQSPALQQKLFFQPVSDKDYQPELNPLLQELFPLFFQLKEVSSRYEFDNAEDICKQDWFQDDRRRMRVLRPEASWRHMVPVQPPARVDALLVTGICCTNENFTNHGVIRSEFEHLQEKGAPMRLIYDISVDFFDNNASGSFFIRWHMFPALPEEESDGNNLLLDIGNCAGPDLANKITLYIAYYESCMAWKAIAPSGLKVIECDPKLIEYGDEGT